MSTPLDAITLTRALTMIRSAGSRGLRTEELARLRIGKTKRWAIVHALKSVGLIRTERGRQVGTAPEVDERARLDEAVEVALRYYSARVEAMAG